MSGDWRRAWSHTWDEIWLPLGLFETETDSAPAGLYGDLLVCADDFLAPRLTVSELEEARNSPGAAEARFEALEGSDFYSETAVVGFIEAAATALADYDVAGLVTRYSMLVTTFISKFNLRYRIDDPFTVRFLLPGSFGNLYEELHRHNLRSQHLGDLLLDFEKAFDRYARSEDASDLKTCIAKASNYLEGLAASTHGSPGTLGRLCDTIPDWPHDKVRDALKNMYGFCSDYPGIRHAGNPSGANRDLAIRDVTLASLLLLSFAGYLTPHLDERAMLGI